LARLGLATIEIDRLKTITVDGSYYGAQSTHFVSNRTDVLVVLAPTFETHGDVIARGPILSLAHTMGNLASATWVFADDNAFPRGSLDGPRVYAGPQATMGQASVPGERVGPFFEGRLADLNSPDPRVRDDAVRVFAENTVSAELRTPAVAALRPLLKDPDEMVRGRAAWALGELAGQDAVADLVEALADPNRFVRAQILHTLLKLGPSTLSVPALIEILENKAKIQTTAARALAATGLGRIGGPAAIAALKEALATANRDVDSGADDDKTMTAHFLRKAWAEALEAIAETQ
jgi:hypothetical protein